MHLRIILPSSSLVFFLQSTIAHIVVHYLGKPEDGENECMGYCVTSLESGGTLCLLQEEFKIWATHNKLDSNVTKNNYTCNMTSGTWYVRHHNCKDVYLPPTKKHCDDCKSLGEPRGVQRLVIRFIAKYHCAHLLSKRLFSPQEEAQDYVAQVASSAYGQKHAVQWKRLSELSNQELQSYVRSSFASISPQEHTSALQMLIHALVQPCLKVNPTCISSRMVSLFSGFVEALSKQNLTVPCLLISCIC